MAVATGSAELSFLLEREGVDTGFSEKLFAEGVDTVGKFAALVDDQTELRELLKTEFGMDSEGRRAEDEGDRGCYPRAVGGGQEARREARRD